MLIDVSKEHSDLTFRVRHSKKNRLLSLSCCILKMKRRIYQLSLRNMQNVASSSSTL